VSAVFPTRASPLYLKPSWRALRASSGVPLDYPGSFCGQALAQPGALPEFGDGFQSDNTTQSLRANIPAREIPCAPAEDHRKIGESLLQRMLTKNEHCQSRVSRVIRNDTLTTSRVTPTALWTTPPRA